MHQLLLELMLVARTRSRRSQRLRHRRNLQPQQPQPQKRKPQLSSEKLLSPRKPRLQRLLRVLIRLRLRMVDQELVGASRSPSRRLRRSRK